MPSFFHDCGSLNVGHSKGCGYRIFKNRCIRTSTGIRRGNRKRQVAGWRTDEAVPLEVRTPTVPKGFPGWGKNLFEMDRVEASFAEKLPKMGSINPFSGEGNARLLLPEQGSHRVIELWVSYSKQRIQKYSWTNNSIMSNSGMCSQGLPEFDLTYFQEGTKTLA